MVALVATMVTVPFFQEGLQTTALSGAQWALVVGGALVGGGWLEGWKALSTRPVSDGGRSPASSAS